MRELGRRRPARERGRSTGLERSELHGAVPPAAASAVTVPRECPITPARGTSTRSPNHAGSSSRTFEMSRTRSAMLNGTLGLAQGPGRASLHVNSWRPACALMKSIRTSSCVLLRARGGHDEPGRRRSAPASARSRSGRSSSRGRTRSPGTLGRPDRSPRSSRAISASTVQDSGSQEGGSRTRGQWFTVQGRPVDGLGQTGPPAGRRGTRGERRPARFSPWADPGTAMRSTG